MSDYFIETTVFTTESNAKKSIFNTARRPVVSAAFATAVAVAGSAGVDASEVEFISLLTRGDSDLNYEDVEADGLFYQFRNSQTAHAQDFSKTLGESGTAVSIADMVAEIKQVFGLNNVQVAQVIGVSRPTLYNHLSGKETPLSLDRYERVHALTEAVSQSIAVDIRRGLKSVLVDGRTLLSYLKDDQIDSEKVLAVASLIADKLLENEGNGVKYSAEHQIRASRGMTKPG